MAARGRGHGPPTRSVLYASVAYGPHLDPWTVWSGGEMSGMKWSLERGMGGGWGAQGGPRFEQIHGVKPVATTPERIQARTFSLKDLGEKAHIPTLCTRQGHSVSAHAGLCLRTNQGRSDHRFGEAGRNCQLPDNPTGHFTCVSVLVGLPKMQE